VAVACGNYLYIFVYGGGAWRFDPTEEKYTAIPPPPLADWHCFSAAVIWTSGLACRRRLLLISIIPQALGPHIYLVGGITQGRWTGIFILGGMFIVKKKIFVWLPS
jgi:hypothetical protein